MLDFEVDICEKCGVVGLITRINEDFHFPCICHSPNHFLTHFLCNSCLQTFKPNPKESHEVIVSIDTFNIFLKAHPKYWKMFNHNIKIEFEKVHTSGTIIYLSIDNEYKGYLIVSDKIKESSKKINTLKSVINNDIVIYRM